MTNTQTPTKSLLVTKILLAILTVSLIVLIRQLFFNDTVIWVSLLAMLALPSSAFLLARQHLNPQSKQVANTVLQENPEVKNYTATNLLYDQQISDSEQLAKIHYLLHLANPENDLRGKTSFAIKLLPELMPEKLFVFYAISENMLRYAGGSRKNSRQNCECIPEGDSLIEELAGKIRGCLDLRAVRLAGSFTDILDFTTSKSGKEGLLVPVSLHGQLYGIIASIAAGSDAFSLKEKQILQHFACGFALMLDNHNIFAGQTEEKEASANRRLAQSLFSRQLPAYAPAIKGWEMAQFTSYADEHAGDFHDYINLAGDRLLIILGKASGKGLDAALFFTRIKVMINCLVDQNLTPADLLNRLSTKLSSESTNDLFASVVALQVKAGEKRATIAIAGHAVPLINRPRSGFVELANLNNGVPLGLFNQGMEPYENQTIQLLPGDGILLYTDGVLELPEQNGQNINLEGLKLMLDKIPQQPAEVLLQSLTTSLFPVRNIRNSCEDYTLIYAKTE